MKKTIVFLGSSVTYGDNGWSMCEYVNGDERYSTVKWAVSGTTLSDISEDSYVNRLKNQIDTQDCCDCFICQLSTNDAARDLTLGTICESKNINDFDTTTIIGAMEYIISRVSEKWNIEILDLWNDPQMRAISKEDYDKYMSDHVHPNRLGYTEWWGPKFIERLNKIFDK